MLIPIILFLLSETQLYVLVVFLSAKDNHKRSKHLSKEFERSVYGSEYKTIGQNKNTTNECRYFIELNFVGLNRLFALVYTKEDDNVERFKSGRYFLTKGINKNYNVITDRKNFHSQAIDSDIKRYKEIRKLTTRQGDDYTTGCLLDYDYIKYHYRVMAADLSRPKELDVDPKAIQQMEFVGELK